MAPSQAVHACTMRGMLCIEPRAIEALGWGFVGWAYAGVETSASLQRDRFAISLVASLLPWMVWLLCGLLEVQKHIPFGNDKRKTARAKADAGPSLRSG